MTKGSKGKQEKQVACNVSVDGEWARGDAPAGTVNAGVASESGPREREVTGAGPTVPSWSLVEGRKVIRSFTESFGCCVTI